MPDVYRLQVLLLFSITVIKKVLPLFEHPIPNFFLSSNTALELLFRSILNLDDF